MMGKGKMFAKRNNSDIDTLVGPNTRVSGDVEFSGGFHVNGYIKGNIAASTDSESVLTISKEGTVEGSVSVPHVILHGTVRGDVTVRERVNLGSTARVVGNVYYKSIKMDEGAEINGKLVHQPGAQTVPMASGEEPSAAARQSGEAVEVGRKDGGQAGRSTDEAVQVGKRTSAKEETVQVGKTTANPVGKTAATT